MKNFNINISILILIVLSFMLGATYNHLIELEMKRAEEAREARLSWMERQVAKALKNGWQ